MGKKKACLISGGGAWGAYGGGTLARINENYDTVIGVSTGSLLAGFTALREWEILKVGYTNLNMNSVFDKCWYKGMPISKKGRIKKFPIIMTLLMGNKSISTSNALRKTIIKFFPKEYFKEFQTQNKEILVGTQNFAQVPSRIHYFSSQNEKYDDFIDWIWCSTCFPFFTSLVKKSWRDDTGNFHIGQWSDGSLSELVGINQLSGKKYKEIDIILHRTKLKDKYEGKRIHNLMGNVSSCFNRMKCDIEFKYLYERIKKLNKQGVKIRVFWLPRKLSINSMIFNREQMMVWWDEGYETAFDPDRVETFLPITKKF